MRQEVRQELKQIENQRMRFKAIFERYGKKHAYRGADITTILLREIRIFETGEQITEHLWFTQTKGFESLGELKEGDCIEFDARVTTYIKGYHGRREDVYKPSYKDWRLSYPTKIRLYTEGKKNETL